jgi:hypothetical protein
MPIYIVLVFFVLKMLPVTDFTINLLLLSISGPGDISNRLQVSGGTWGTPLTTGKGTFPHHSKPFPNTTSGKLRIAREKLKLD